MATEYLKDGDKEILSDGTLVEKNEECIIVHNVPSDKGIFKNAILETWINELLENKDYKVKDINGDEVLAKDAIIERVITTCSSEWGIAPRKIAEALEVIHAEDSEEPDSTED